MNDRDVAKLLDEVKGMRHQLKEQTATLRALLAAEKRKEDAAKFDWPPAAAPPSEPPDLNAYEVVGIDTVTELPIRRYLACPTCGRRGPIPAVAAAAPPSEEETR